MHYHDRAIPGERLEELTDASGPIAKAERPEKDGVRGIERALIRDLGLAADRLERDGAGGRESERKQTPTGGLPFLRSGHRGFGSGARWADSPAATGRLGVC